MAISLVLPIIIITIIAIITMIIISAKTSEGKSEGGQVMIKHVYVYLVLFATLMMTIGGSVSAFMAVADLVAPAPYYQSFEDFKRWGDEKPYTEKEAAQYLKPSENELKERYDAMVQAETERQIGRAKNSLVKSFGWILIPLAIFIYFQRHLAKSKA